MAQKLTLVRALPVPAPESVEPGGYLFEQPPADLLAALLPRYIEAKFYRALLESVAAEHAARMTGFRSGHRYIKRIQTGI